MNQEENVNKKRKAEEENSSSSKTEERNSQLVEEEVNKIRAELEAKYSQKIKEIKANQHKPARKTKKEKKKSRLALADDSLSDKETKKKSYID